MTSDHGPETVGGERIGPIDSESFLERLPDGWELDGAEDFDVFADNRHTDSKLLRRVSVEVEYPNHHHYHPKFYASFWKEHPLPNVGPDEEIEQCETLEEAINRAVGWSHGDNYTTGREQ